jgi:hypothetical protein
MCFPKVLKKVHIIEWALLDSNQRPRDSGLCEFPRSPDYLITFLSLVRCRALTAVIKRAAPLR